MSMKWAVVNSPLLQAIQSLCHPPPDLQGSLIDGLQLSNLLFPCLSDTELLEPRTVSAGTSTRNFNID